MARPRHKSKPPNRAKKPKLDAPRQFTSNRPVLLVNDSGPVEIISHRVSPNQVGWKAVGLTVLPEEWAPAFFVVSATCFDSQLSLDLINDWSSKLQARLGLKSESHLMIRSSGTAETMLDRGSLISELSLSTNVALAIDQLRNRISPLSRPLVHWIVQQAVRTKRKGHLSNERHVSKEPRDWLVEIEIAEDYPGKTIPIGIRSWREGEEPSSLDLSCNSEAEIPIRLRDVAKWASQFTKRIHFEWVWDGRRLWIVQADTAAPLKGVDPTIVLPSRIETPNVGDLQVFRVADGNDYERYIKLRNAALYMKLGYKMPPFFIVDNREVISRILAGEIPPEMERDLQEMVKRPLILRTDGLNIPSHKREMLPRSDRLATPLEASEWILTAFRDEISKLDLATKDVCIVAHHFIPSVASAWARAEPGRRFVRIESLWGIPEGLYWYSHDTIEVDTGGVELKKIEEFSKLPYRAIPRIRYKGTFVTADESGRWKSASVLPPHDWRLSIKKPEWISEIAYTTRRVAEAGYEPTALMWFIDNHPSATCHSVLPWFHSKSELPGNPTAAPRRKRTTSRDFSLKSDADWRLLRQRLQVGESIVRVIVEPSDPAIIRNPTFAKDLAHLSVAHNFVIELFGGILSHAYYLLTKNGAKVECIDLFGIDEDHVPYNKIVRDRIPDLIASRGESAKIVKLRGDALVKALRRKLIEEAFEALDAGSGEDLVGELADVNEVIDGLCAALRVSKTSLKAVQMHKRKSRGGFQNGIMLTRTLTPHSIQPAAEMNTDGELDLTAESSLSQVIEDPADIPGAPLYRRPDLRLVGGQVEKLFAIAKEISEIDDLKESLDFTLPLGQGDEQDYTLTVELSRSGGTLRGNVRLLLRPTQLPINFPEEEGNGRKPNTPR